MLRSCGPSRERCSRHVEYPREHCSGFRAGDAGDSGSFGSSVSRRVLGSPHVSDWYGSCAVELAEDCGMIPDGLAWPLTCIDWVQAAEELQQDYMSYEFDGYTYWVR